MTVTHDNSLDDSNADIFTEHDDITDNADTRHQTDTDHDDIDLTTWTETHYNRKYFIDLQYNTIIG